MRCLLLVLLVDCVYMISIVEFTNYINSCMSCTIFQPGLSSFRLECLAIQNVSTSNQQQQQCFNNSKLRNISLNFYGADCGSGGNQYCINVTTIGYLPCDVYLPSFTAAEGDAISISLSTTQYILHTELILFGTKTCLINLITTDNPSFHISSTLLILPPSTATATSTTSPTNSTNSFTSLTSLYYTLSRGELIGLIVGVVGGSLLLIIFLIILICCLRKRRSKKNKNPVVFDNPYHDPSAHVSPAPGGEEYAMENVFQAPEPSAAAEEPATKTDVSYSVVQKRNNDQVESCNSQISGSVDSGNNSTQIRKSKRDTLYAADNEVMVYDKTSNNYDTTAVENDFSF